VVALLSTFAVQGRNIQQSLHKAGVDFSPGLGDDEFQQALK